MDPQATADAGAVPDAGPKVDAGTEDAGLDTRDAGTDAGAPDSGSEDAGPPDASWPAHAFVVAPGGNDADPGTPTQPWRTLGKAARTLTAGQTAYLRSGTWHERLVPAQSGTDAGVITFTAWQGEVPTLDGTGVCADWSGLVHLANRAHIEVSGLTLVNYAECGGMGFFLENATDIRVLRNSTTNTGRSGIYVEASANVLVEGNDIADANKALNQESLSVANSHDVIVRSNVVHGGAMEGIDAKAGSHHVTITGNLVYATARIGIYADAWQEGVHDIEISRNIVRSPSPAASGAGEDAIRIGSERGGAVANITITNNLVYDAKYAGVMLAQYHEAGTSAPSFRDVTIANNTVYANNGGGIVIEAGVTNTAVVVANNITSQNRTCAIDVGSPAGVTVTTNLIDGASCTAGAQPIVASPRFVDAGASDFHLLPTSQAIDAASPTWAPSVDLELHSRPLGAGVDLGAYECR